MLTTVARAPGKSVRLRMISEVPLARFLLVLVDSSASCHPAGLSSYAVNTCSISCLVSGYYESEYSRRSPALRTYNYMDRLDSTTSAIARSAIYYEPYADVPHPPPVAACTHARHGGTSAMGRRNFGGYMPLPDALTKRTARSASAGAGKPSSAPRRAYPQPTGCRARCAPRPRSRPWRELPGGLVHGVPRQGQIARVCSQPFQENTRRRTAQEVFLSSATGGDGRSAGLFISRPEDLPGRRHKHQVDRASRAHSLESRPLWITCSWNGCIAASGFEIRCDRAAPSAVCNAPTCRTIALSCEAGIAVPLGAGSAVRSGSAWRRLPAVNLPHGVSANPLQRC